MLFQNKAYHSGFFLLLFSSTHPIQELFFSYMERLRVVKHC